MADADALREPASGVITTASPPPGSGGSGMPDDSVMSLVEHNKAVSGVILVVDGGFTSVTRRESL